MDTKWRQENGLTLPDLSHNLVYSVDLSTEQLAYRNISLDTQSSALKSLVYATTEILKLQLLLTRTSSKGKRSWKMRLILAPPDSSRVSISEPAPSILFSSSWLNVVTILHHHTTSSSPVNQSVSTHYKSENRLSLSKLPAYLVSINALSTKYLRVFVSICLWSPPKLCNARHADPRHTCITQLTQGLELISLGIKYTFLKMHFGHCSTPLQAPWSPVVGWQWMRVSNLNTEITPWAEPRIARL